MLLVLGTGLLASCGCGKTIVYEPMVIPIHISANQVEIVHCSDTIAVSSCINEKFEKELRKKLYCDNLVQNAPGIQLRYRFVQFNEGNRLMRYALGGLGNTGEASILVEVTYVGLDGTELGRIHTEGKISSGLFGGSCDHAIEKAASEVANYTRGVILNRGCPLAE